MADLPADLPFDLGATVKFALAPIDHVAAGLSRLYTQFRKPQIINVLTGWLTRFDTLEAVAQDLLTKRTIFTAVGVQEDLIGDIVVQPRNGLDDATYRVYLLARIAVNNSSGTVEDLIKIATLILDAPAAQVVVTQQSVATVLVRIAGLAITPPLALVLIDLLREAPLAGVRLRLEYTLVSPAQTFTYDGPPAYGSVMAYGGSYE